jgi:hypothetical protein
MDQHQQPQQQPAAQRYWASSAGDGIIPSLAHPSTGAHVDSKKSVEQLATDAQITPIRSAPPPPPAAAGGGNERTTTEGTAAAAEQHQQHNATGSPPTTGAAPIAGSANNNKMHSMSAALHLQQQLQVYFLESGILDFAYFGNIFRGDLRGSTFLRKLTVWGHKLSPYGFLSFTPNFQQMNQHKFVNKAKDIAQQEDLPPPSKHGPTNAVAGGGLTTETEDAEMPSQSPRSRPFQTNHLISFLQTQTVASNEFDGLGTIQKDSNCWHISRRARTANGRKSDAGGFLINRILCHLGIEFDREEGPTATQ